MDKARPSELREERARIVDMPINAPIEMFQKREALRIIDLLISRVGDNIKNTP